MITSTFPISCLRIKKMESISITGLYLNWKLWSRSILKRSKRRLTRRNWRGRKQLKKSKRKLVKKKQKRNLNIRLRKLTCLKECRNNRIGKIRKRKNNFWDPKFKKRGRKLM